MKTIDEELAEAKEYASNLRLKPDDPGYWASAIGWFKAAMRHREKELLKRIDELEEKLK